MDKAFIQTGSRMLAAFQKILTKEIIFPNANENTETIALEAETLFLGEEAKELQFEKNTIDFKQRLGARSPEPPCRDGARSPEPPCRDGARIIQDIASSIPDDFGQPHDTSVRSHAARDIARLLTSKAFWEADEAALRVALQDVGTDNAPRIDRPSKSAINIKLGPDNILYIHKQCFHDRYTKGLETHVMKDGGAILETNVVYAVKLEKGPKDDDGNQTFRTVVSTDFCAFKSPEPTLSSHLMNCDRNIFQKLLAYLSDVLRFKGIYFEALEPRKYARVEDTAPCKHRDHTLAPIPQDAKQISRGLNNERAMVATKSVLASNGMNQFSINGEGGSDAWWQNMRNLPPQAVRPSAMLAEDRRSTNNVLELQQTIQVLSRKLEEYEDYEQKWAEYDDQWKGLLAKKDQEVGELKEQCKKQIEEFSAERARLDQDVWGLQEKHDGLIQRLRKADATVVDLRIELNQHGITDPTNQSPHSEASASPPPSVPATTD